MAGASGVADEAGAWLQYLSRDSLTLLVRIGVSYVDIGGARANLKNDQPDWDFERLRLRADSAWNAALSRIDVRGGRDADRTMFYTALYHTLLHPSLFNDADGRYRRFGGAGGIGRNAVRYSGFSLWDTYRTVHPLLAVAYPERDAAMVQSLLEMQREQGWLPLWELAGQEANAMVGDPAAIVIAEAFLKGVASADPRAALDALVRNATEAAPWTIDEGQSKARIAVIEYQRLGYVPEPSLPTRLSRVAAAIEALVARARHRFTPRGYENARLYGSVSTTQDYAHADVCIARLARLVGDEIVARRFARRALNHRSLYAANATEWESGVRGFFRPRRADGSWADDSPILAPQAPRRQRVGFVEGDEWSYLFNAPHDIDGLAALAGSPAALSRKLDRYFDAGAHDPSNEPPLAYPYLYDFLGSASRTQARVQRLLEAEYHATPTGLPGEDDAGTLSAWLVWSEIGLYPVDPCGDELAITSPVFDSVIVARGVGRVPLRITVVRGTGADRHIGGATLGGRPWPYATVRLRDFEALGVLALTMTVAPSNWGARRSRDP